MHCFYSTARDNLLWHLKTEFPSKIAASALIIKVINKFFFSFWTNGANFNVIIIEEKMPRDLICG